MKRTITLLITITIVVLAALPACDKNPTEPKYDNPFDIQNPATGGDPFQLTAKIDGGGIPWNGINRTLPICNPIKYTAASRKQAATRNWQRLTPTKPTMWIKLLRMAAVTGTW